MFASSRQLYNKTLCFDKTAFYEFCLLVWFGQKLLYVVLYKKIEEYPAKTSLPGRPLLLKEFNGGHYHLFPFSKGNVAA